MKTHLVYAPTYRSGVPEVAQGDVSQACIDPGYRASIAQVTNPALEGSTFDHIDWIHNCKPWFTGYQVRIGDAPLRHGHDGHPGVSVPAVHAYATLVPRGLRYRPAGGYHGQAHRRRGMSAYRGPVAPGILEYDFGVSQYDCHWYKERTDELSHGLFIACSRRSHKVRVALNRDPPQERKVGVRLAQGRRGLSLTFLVTRAYRKERTTS